MFVRAWNSLCQFQAYPTQTTSVRLKEHEEGDSLVIKKKTTCPALVRLFLNAIPLSVHTNTR